LQKSRTLNEKHAQMSAGYAYQRGGDSLFEDSDAESVFHSQHSRTMTRRDWTNFLAMTPPVSSQKRAKIREAMISHGVPDNFRGAVWMKLLEIEQAMEVHSTNLY